MKIFCESSVSKRKKNYEHTINKNHIKIQNTVTFEKKKIEDKHAKDKKYCNFRGSCHYTEE